MSITRNALIRYQTLDRCFRNTGRMYFWEDLLEECNKALIDFDPSSNGIQRRQLFDDLLFMESEAGWSVPLNRVQYGKRKYYRYEDPSFSINNQPLNDSEVEQIKSAMQIISRFSGSPQFEWINEIIPKLESKFGFIERKSEVISFDSNIDLKGTEHLTPLFNAIINERTLLVQYQDFKSPEPYEFIFHPYYLKQYNNRWFVFGLNAENQFPTWNLALDRIVSIQESSDKYILSETDWEDYFFDIVGVTRTEDRESQEITLEFSQEVAPYITTKPLHATQKEKYTSDGQLEVRINVIPNIELDKLILSYSDQVKVISPIDYRKRIAEKLKTASSWY